MDSEIPLCFTRIGGDDMVSSAKEAVSRVFDGFGIIPAPEIDPKLGAKPAFTVYGRANTLPP